MIRKMIKASDEQWIKWIGKVNIEDEKRWAKLFLFFAVCFFILGLILSFFVNLLIGMAFCFGSLLFYIMSLTKYINFRLYRIIKNNVSLDKNQYEHTVSLDKNQYIKFLISKSG